MLRTGASRSLARAVVRSSQTPSVANAPCKLRSTTQSRVLSFKAPTARLPVPYRPVSLALVRHAHGGGGALSAESQRHQDRLKNEFLKVTPQAVTTSSSVRDSVETAAQEEDVDMGAGIRSDIKTIQETFSLSEVPREALWVGMAGVVPYLATSLSTVFLAWDMNHAAHTGYGVIFSEKTAELLLHIIEPLQIGYGAVIISFLGAIHWGLEWAKFGGDFGYKRYWIGVIAPAVAWPTTLMPIEYALITQFLAFNWLYFSDANAASRGMAPHWYGIYRFVLTFVVGASIVASLIGRGQITEMVGRPSTALHKIQQLQEERAALMEREEDIKEHYMAEEEAAREHNHEAKEAKE